MLMVILCNEMTKRENKLWCKTSRLTCKVFRLNYSGYVNVQLCWDLYWLHKQPTHEQSLISFCRYPFVSIVTSCLMCQASAKVRRVSKRFQTTPSSNLDNPSSRSSKRLFIAYLRKKTWIWCDCSGSFFLCWATEAEESLLLRRLNRISQQILVMLRADEAWITIFL